MHIHWIYFFFNLYNKKKWVILSGFYSLGNWILEKILAISPFLVSLIPPTITNKKIKGWGIFIFPDLFYAYLCIISSSLVWFRIYSMFSLKVFFTLKLLQCKLLWCSFSKQMDNQIVVSDYVQMDRVLREERSYILNLVKQIKKTGCNVLLIQKSILRCGAILFPSPLNNNRFWITSSNF